MMLKVGDIVRQKAGGPEMTVVGVDLRSSDAICIWLVNNVFQRNRFKFLTLQKIERRSPRLEQIELAVLLENCFTDR
jgi:uncharacterized protein YodC (DUF2158 family)